MITVSRTILVVMLGGAIGSALRFGLSCWIQERLPYATFPWGIWIVNLLGCFCMGVLFGLSAGRWVLHPLWRAGLMLGLLGGFTTFSSFSMDTIVLLQSAAWFTALIYILASVVGCLLATLVGILLVNQLF